MVLLRAARLVVFLLLGSGWGLLPEYLSQPIVRHGFVLLTEASDETP